MGTARAPCSASGVPPACSARVRKPKVCSAIGLLLVYLPACVRGVDSGSTLYCATGGGVHQVRVPICRLLRIMTGWMLVGLELVASAPPTPTLHYSADSSSGSCSSITYPASSRGGRYFLNS